MVEIKQFNFKIPMPLYKQLYAAATAKGVKMTSLVIEGINQVLGITAISSEDKVNLNNHQVIDKISSRLDKLEQSQVDIAARVYQYIPELEQIRKDILDENIVNDIVNTVYEKIKKDIKNLVSENTALTVDKNNIVPSIDKSIDGETNQKLNNMVSDIDNSIDGETNQKLNNIVSDIDNSIDRETNQKLQILPLEYASDSISEGKETLGSSSDSISEGKETLGSSSKPLTEEIQIKIPEIENKKKSIFSNKQRLNSIELLNILKEHDPKGKWDNEKLTNYRRYKRYKDSWNKAGKYHFKYANEIDENKVSGISKHLHLWWLVEKEVKKETVGHDLKEAQDQVESNHERTEIHPDS
jgi:hypothetical protein